MNIRVKHDKNNPYVILNKLALEDENLSWAAKGLWSYLLSRPDDWHVSVNHLSTIFGGRGGGKEAIYNYIKELIENGYCERVQEKNPDGKWGYGEYIIHEFKKSLPNRENPDAGKTDPVEPIILSNDSLPCNEKTTTGGASPPPKPPDAVVFFECLKGIEIPESEKDWICKNYDEPTVKHAIAVVTHPSFVVKETLQQAIKWACKAKPAIPKKEEDIEKENREIAQKIEKYTVSTSNSFYAAVNSGAEIGFPVQGIVEVIKYTEKQFKQLLKKALNHYKVNIKKESIDEVKKLLA